MAQAKMKLVTPDIDVLAEAIAKKLGYLLLEGVASSRDPHRGKCPNCGKPGFIDYCFGCRFVPFWDRKGDVNGPAT